MPTLSVVSCSNLSSSTLSRAPRPFFTVHLGKKPLGKTSVVYEATDDDGLYEWFPDDSTATISWSEDDEEDMYDSHSEDEESLKDDSSSDGNSSDSSHASSSSSNSSNSSTSSNSSNSSTSSTSTSSSVLPTPELYLQCWHSKTGSRKSYLGCATIPLSAFAGLKAGSALSQTFSLMPRSGFPNKHVSGNVTVKMVSTTVNELLKFLLTSQPNSKNEHVGVLQRSASARERGENLSEKVDKTLDRYWNNLEQ
ncbi:hypothetical protein TeGR_g8777, partial [Tetraparma gracilis]